VFDDRTMQQNLGQTSSNVRSRGTFFAEWNDVLPPALAGKVTPMEFSNTIRMLNRCRRKSRIVNISAGVLYVVAICIYEAIAPTIVACQGCVWALLMFALFAVVAGVLLIFWATSVYRSIKRKLGDIINSENAALYHPRGLHLVWSVERWASLTVEDYGPAPQIVTVPSTPFPESNQVVAPSAFAPSTFAPYPPYYMPYVQYTNQPPYQMSPVGPSSTQSVQSPVPPQSLSSPLQPTLYPVYYSQPF